MRRLVIGITALVLSAPAALAGAMPALPDLPPLPTTYQTQTDWDGFYATIFGGGDFGSDRAGFTGVAVGHTGSAADLLLGVEAAVALDSNGDALGFGGLRLGWAASDEMAFFLDAGLGTTTDAGAFVGVGGTLEINVGNGWGARGGYRFDHDLSGGPDAHRVSLGLVYRFGS